MSQRYLITFVGIKEKSDDQEELDVVTETYTDIFPCTEGAKEWGTQTLDLFLDSSIPWKQRTVAVTEFSKVITGPKHTIQVITPTALVDNYLHCHYRSRLLPLITRMVTACSNPNEFLKKKAKFCLDILKADLKVELNLYKPEAEYTEVFYRNIENRIIIFLRNKDSKTVAANAG